MIFPQFYKRKGPGDQMMYFMALREFTIKDTISGREHEYVRNIKAGINLVGLYFDGKGSAKKMFSGVVWGNWERITVKQFSNYILKKK